MPMLSSCCVLILSAIGCNPEEEIHRYDSKTADLLCTKGVKVLGGLHHSINHIIWAMSVSTLNFKAI